MSKEKLCGILCFNKPRGCTSHDVIYKVRKLYGTRQVGHTGTLDPLAEGVLVVMVGRAVKAADLLSSDTKEYVATLKLGLTTDTEDITGTVIKQFYGMLPDFTTVKNVSGEFVGDIMQVPPMYSALKVDGKKLVDLARKGKEIEREKRRVKVEKLELYETESPGEYLMNVRVSKGTYIRTLCADIGNRLGCGAVMKTLIRTSAGAFGIENSYTEEQLMQMSAEEKAKALIPIEMLFENVPGVKLSDFFSKLASCGCEIYQKKIGSDFTEGSLVKMYDSDGFFAIGKVQNYQDGTAIKPLKQFRIK